MPLSLFQALKLRFHKTPVGPIRRALAAAERAGIAVTVEQLDMHSLAGGDVERLVATMIEARRSGKPHDFRIMAARDLARVMGIELPEEGK
jgi:uncharacterized protein YqfA (UPF0365 family)